MTLMQILIGLSYGLSGAFTVLWAWFGVRVALYSWDVYESPPEIRESAWNWFRTGILLLAFTMVVPYNLENILRQEMLISKPVCFAILNSAHLLHCIAVCCCSVGLDIYRGCPRRTFFSYMTIPVSFMVTGLVLR